MTARTYIKLMIGSDLGLYQASIKPRILPLIIKVLTGARRLSILDTFIDSGLLQTLVHNGYVRQLP